LWTGLTDPKAGCAVYFKGLVETGAWSFFLHWVLNHSKEKHSAACKTIYNLGQFSKKQYDEIFYQYGDSIKNDVLYDKKRDLIACCNMKPEDIVAFEKKLGDNFEMIGYKSFKDKEEIYNKFFKNTAFQDAR
jgi:hypothetical protein